MTPQAIIGRALKVGIMFIVFGFGGTNGDERSDLSLSTAHRLGAVAIALATPSVSCDHNVLSTVLLYLLLNVANTSAYMFCKIRDQAPASLCLAV
jgi:hypothetical protein